MEKLSKLQQQIDEYLREQAEQQGITRDRKGFQLTPKAYRLFQSQAADDHLQRACRRRGPAGTRTR